MLNATLLPEPTMGSTTALRHLLGVVAPRTLFFKIRNVWLCVELDVGCSDQN